MAATEVNARWQAEMAEFFSELDGGPPDEGCIPSLRSSISAELHRPGTWR